MSKRTTVVWLCQFSNQEVREKTHIRKLKIEHFMRRIIGRNGECGTDLGIWITNAINEIKNYTQIELHIICPIRDLRDKRQDFEIDGVYYHFFRDENSALWRKAIRYCFTRYSSQFRKNRKYINNIITELKPDLVHIIGAENPYYSLSLLDISNSIPTLLQLQALLASIVDKTTGARKKDFLYKAKYERILVERADYVGTVTLPFVNFIRREIKESAIILNTTLAMAQTINLTSDEKIFDFVHYAATLGQSKATDVAIEAFAIAHKKYPNIKLDIIGNMAKDFQVEIEARIKELDIQSAVFFEGLLPTHEDVIKQIRKSNYALLPLKVSIVPNTVHEAIANGLPVVTTETPGTPEINSKKECVLISSPDDAEDIARNMIKLIEDKELGEILRKNAAEYEYELENNEAIIYHWVEVYDAIIQNKRTGREIPSEFLM